MIRTHEVIRELRIKNKLTQIKLAEQLDIKLSTLQKYESGAIQNIKLCTLRRMCRIFKTTPCAILFPDLDQKEKRELVRRNIKHYIQLDEEAANKIIEYLDDMIKLYQKSR